MVQFRALKAEERNRILLTLNSQQTKAYWDSIAYRLSDRLLNQVFHGSAAWHLVSVNIDYEWDLRKAGKRHSEPLKCMCGRHLRYQYELEAVENPKKHVKLGSTHFAQHLNIPPSVATEVRRNINQIQSLMDEVLIKYRAGQRFPEQFVGGIEAGILMREQRPFREKILAYKSADMPLPMVFERRLTRLFSDSVDVVQGERQRPLTKEEKLAEIERAEFAATRERQDREAAERKRLDAEVDFFRKFSRNGEYQRLREAYLEQERALREEKKKEEKRRNQQRLKAMREEQRAVKLRSKIQVQEKPRRTVAPKKSVPQKRSVQIGINDQLRRELEKWKRSNS